LSVERIEETYEVRGQHRFGDLFGSFQSCHSRDRPTEAFAAKLKKQKRERERERDRQTDRQRRRESERVRRKSIRKVTMMKKVPYCSE
jgi:hypothetical protein